jgi:hypothetical protein
MSALPTEADIRHGQAYVGYVPFATVWRCPGDFRFRPKSRNSSFDMSQGAKPRHQICKTKRKRRSKAAFQQIRGSAFEQR